jgi:3-hydroxybutyryl-CoA dehydratase
MIKISNIKIGDNAQIVKKFTDEDLLKFSELSEDKNPIHLNDEYAKQSRYKKRINYGLLCASLFSGIFGSKIPGPSCVYKSQTLKFLRPIPVNLEITASVVVNKVDKKKKIIYFDTLIKENKKIFISGQAQIFLPDII